jgi:hypothetical protein
MLEGIREDSHIKVDYTAWHFIKHLLTISFWIICHKFWKRFRVILKLQFIPQQKFGLKKKKKKKKLLVHFSGFEPKFLVTFPLNLSFFAFSPETSGKEKEKKLSLIHFKTKQDIKCPKIWKSNNPI